MKKWIHLLNNMKLRKKLILTYLAVSIVPIAILGILLFWKTNWLLLEKEGLKQQESLSQATSGLMNKIQIYNNLSDYIAFNQTIMQVIAYDYENYYDMYEKYTSLLDPLLGSLLYFHNDVERVTIYTENSTVEHDTTIAPLDQVKNEVWYEEVMSHTGIYWYAGYQNGVWKAFLVRQIPKETGKTKKGLLYIELSYDELFESFQNIADHNYGVLTVDKKNSLVFKKSGLDQTIPNTILELIIREPFKKGERLKIQNGYQIAKDQIESGDFTFYLYQPVYRIAKDADSMISTIFFFVLICLFLVAAVGYAMSYLLVHRLERLNQNMHHVENGNLSVWVGSDSEDEIGELVRSFEKMIGKIQFLIEEVYQNEIHLKESEMKALQAQINPHFLYNSLSVINWKALAANETQISQLTLLLSCFYRTTLNKGKNSIQVTDELKNMDSYLEIQLIMHDYSFDIERNIDPSISEHKMPNLMLQPIVENSVGHGIDLLEERRGLLKITGIQKTDTFVFIIEDNGVGMDEETANSILTFQAKGYGVRNVNERIKLIYGSKFGLIIESVEGSGTKVTMELSNALNLREEFHEK